MAEPAPTRRRSTYRCRILNIRREPCRHRVRFLIRKRISPPARMRHPALTAPPHLRNSPQPIFALRTRPPTPDPPSASLPAELRRSAAVSTPRPWVCAHQCQRELPTPPRPTRRDSAKPPRL